MSIDHQQFTKLNDISNIIQVSHMRLVYLCRMRKLMYRVVFPIDLKLRNTTDSCPDADETYRLFGVVVHVGSGPNHGEKIFK